MTFKRENKISMVLFVIGIIYIFLGFILGLALGVEDTFGSYERGRQLWSVTFMWWSGGFVSGITFIGFSEIIEQLHQSNDLKRKELVSLNILDNSPPSEMSSEEEIEVETPSVAARQLAKVDELMIYELYAKKKQEVEKIINTPFQDFCLVKVNGEFDLIEVGSFKPELKDINQFIEIKKWFEENKHQL